jgi:protocatechuate 3,4-dioxygenase beta subunit
VSAPELDEGRKVSTDGDGRYELTDLPAGRYLLRVTRSGYLPLRYGQRRPLEQGTPLQLLDAQVVDNVDFTLPRMGLITGRVTDEVGDPIEGVSVFPLRMMFYRGRRQLVPVNSGPQARTDDAGQYRLLGLPPGSYIVQAVTRETWTASVNGVRQLLGYAPTYFPSTMRPGEAQRVTVALGKEVGNVDVSLQTGRAASVSGTAVDSHGRPFPNVTVRTEVRGIDFASFGQIASARVAGDGTFNIDQIPPGEYVLAASTGRDTAQPEVAELPFVIDGVDMSNIVLTGSQGGTITGRILTDTGAVPTLSRLRVTVVEHQAGQLSPTVLGAFRNPGGSEVLSDGTFTVTGVFGRSALSVSTPPDWAIASIQHDGRDVTDQPIELRSGESWSDVQVIITNRLTTLAGQVVDAKGQPTTDGMSVIFATDASKWGPNSRYVRAARPDQQGQWQVKGLPAGDYLAVALDDVEDGTWNDPDYLASIERYAHKITMQEAEAQSITLKLTQLQP